MHSENIDGIALYHRRGNNNKLSRVFKHFHVNMRERERKRERERERERERDLL